MEDHSATPPAGIYIHWPFCARKCPYCDFYTFGKEHVWFSRSESYLVALLVEIRSTPERFGLKDRPRADTIYFGGGTPSLMAPMQIESVLQALEEVFELKSDREVTLEVNPTAAQAARLDPARRLGVNRLSIGCQSFNDRFLKLLGRDHDAADVRRTLELARELGYDNLSLDLMLGLPDQTIDEFESDLEEALRFAPEHLSVYGLTYHEGTPFHRWRSEGRLRACDPEVEADQFEHLVDRMAEAGYQHYEISNWSKPGRSSRHNTKYWSCCDVFGYGASAHGVYQGIRGENGRDLEKYLEERSRDAQSPIAAESNGSARAKPGEIMMLALRRIGGVRWAELRAWARSWGVEAPLDDLAALYRAELVELTKKGLLEADDDGLRLTRRGLLLADEVMLKFF